MVVTANDFVWSSMAHTQGQSYFDDVYDACLDDCDARNGLCDVSFFDCFVTEQNAI